VFVPLDCVPVLSVPLDCVPPACVLLWVPVECVPVPATANEPTEARLEVGRCAPPTPSSLLLPPDPPTPPPLVSDVPAQPRSAAQVIAMIPARPIQPPKPTDLPLA
jgi:hypothetical protein